MSKFLRAGIFRDRLNDIKEASQMLQEALDSGGEEELGRSRELATDIESMVSEIIDFISRWDCEPLIYIGKGTTDQVIAFLDALITQTQSGNDEDLHG
ncbi:MAG TPA: hypothetical protein PLK53_04115 [Bacillota bacterium]|nr:hypothetical protein [Bacillota bacterium]